jgi:hypothetical protein
MLVGVIIRKWNNDPQSLHAPLLQVVSIDSIPRAVAASWLSEHRATESTNSLVALQEPALPLPEPGECRAFACLQVLTNGLIVMWLWSRIVGRRSGGRWPMKKKLCSRKPKRVLRLRDLNHSKTAVLNTLGSQESQRSYRFAIEGFIAWYCSEPRLAFNKTVVLRYRLQLEARHLSASTINVRLAAVRRLAYEAADSGLLSPELAASIRRVKGPKTLGVRLGNWLTAEQGKTLLSIPVGSSGASETLRC